MWCEALIQAQAAVKQLAACGVLPPIAVVDVDSLSCFGLFERPSTLKTVDRQLPELRPWLRWCTADGIVCRCRVENELSAAGCEGWATGRALEASATTGHAAELANHDQRARVNLQHGRGRSTTASCFLHPKGVDPVLRAQDARLAECRASRGSRSLGHKAESRVEAVVDARGWDLARDTCVLVPEEEREGIFLGSRCAPRANSRKQFQYCTLTTEISKIPPWSCC